MSSVTAPRTPDNTSMASGDEISALATLRQGFHYSPELREGLTVTLLLALLGTAGRVVVPIAVQQTLDRGLNGSDGSGGIDLGFVVQMSVLAAFAIVVTGISSYLMTARLFTAAERGLATLRIKAFRHVHDLPLLTQSTERRGSLVSRVTSDVDTISMFVQFGGLMFMVNIAQLLLATVLMVIYSPPLAGVVWACYVPLFFIIRQFQGIVGRAYTAVRERVGDMLAAISEAVVGAATIRAYGVEDRTAERIDTAVEAHRRSAVRAQTRAVMAFTTGQLVSGLTTAVVIVVGTLLAVNGSLTLGELLAFLFLVNLFTTPVQQATEILNEMQNAVAGWRRVIGIIDTHADVSDPGESGVELPRGPITVGFDDVSFAYPGGDTVLHDVSLRIAPRSRVAIVGETGSGKSTLAKLLTRLMDPSSGEVTIDGVDLRRVRFGSLRNRVVLVPQEGFLFDASLLENIRFGAPEATEDDVRLTVTELGLDPWLATDVGQRGESLSAGERQLVALARAYLADPDLLVLDEATSAVDPSTEVRIQRALDSLTRGRTSIAIAHRLSTAQAADEVIVVDGGRVVGRGPHSDLVDAGGVYSTLHASWVSQQQGD